jgi:hypothetical protein
MAQTNSYLIVALAVGVLAGYVLGRFRAHTYQNQGEARLSLKIQTNFAPPDFHLLNHITLKFKDRTTQIDHILVSRFGVFVIETKDYNGWIFADANHKQWTQVLFGRKFKFQNPILQNILHKQAVESLLEFLPSSAIQSVVVFVGKAEFKTNKPSGVFTVTELIDHLQNQTEEIMSINRVHFCVGRLEATRLAVTSQTDLEHIELLERRFGRR